MSASPLQSIDTGAQSSINCAEASSSETQPIWLDLLPRDVIRDIACCLPDGDDYLLSFAGTSARVCAAVRLGVVGGDLKVDLLDTNGWKGVLGGTYVNLTDYRNVERYGSLAEILKAGDWSKGDISFAESVRVTLWDSTLKSLTLYSKPEDGGVRSFMDIAFGEGLKELTVRCGCVHSRFGKSPYSCSVLQAMDYISNAGVSVESKVEKLVLNCLRSCSKGYAMLSKFTHLREVTLYELPILSDSDATKLQQIGSVHLRSLVPQEVSSIVRLGQSVSTLSLKFKGRGLVYLAAEELQILSLCTRLTSLEVGLHHGAGASLASLPSTLRELRLSVGCRFSHHKYYDPTLGSIVELVKRSLCLSVLNLRFVALPPQSVEDVLKAMGPRLRELGLSIPYEESALETLQFVAGLIATHNRNVDQLEMHMPELARFERFSLGTDVRKSPEVCRLQAAIGVLRRRVPRLDVQSLQTAVSRLLGWIEADRAVVRGDSFASFSPKDIPHLERAQRLRLMNIRED